MNFSGCILLGIYNTSYYGEVKLRAKAELDITSECYQATCYYRKD